MRESAAIAPHQGNQRDDAATFAGALRACGAGTLVRDSVTTLQVNVGKLCNMACNHCHVEAGPKRTEVMTAEVAARVIEVLAVNPGIELLDLTGGAPELNPSFRWLVTEARRLGRRVLDRCNLTVIFEPGMADLPEFLAANRVELIASLPCYSADNVTKQRGKGAFDKSIEGLRLVNALGYGRPGSGLILDLVYNPVGPSLPPSQAALQADYKRELGEAFGIEFTRLLTITNMPVKRFADALARSGDHDAYMSLLVNHFNPATVAGLMCRTQLSVGWDGALYDCDFNQMLEMGVGAAAAHQAPRTIWHVEAVDAFVGAQVATANHCFACTAGAGSSCGGALL